MECVRRACREEGALDKSGALLTDRCSDNVPHVDPVKYSVTYVHIHASDHITTSEG
uniref:Uncharacterized protein n=1 Tax=Setaria digitata TaxID=48799 RepID=A0A915Q0T2_9BILA